MKAKEVVVLLILFMLLGVSLYLLYLNWPGEPRELIEIGDDNEEFFKNEPNQSLQFYSNLRFPDSILTYYAEPNCDDNRKSRLQEAFNILESETMLEFRLGGQDSQIIITCQEIEGSQDNEDHFIAGEGGPTEIINTSLYAVALSGKISLYREERCERPNIAIHELLHVLGFDHNNNPGSILYPTLDCDQLIDQYLIDEINRLYSVPGRADLKISEVEATKSGRYLSFEIKVQNQGLKDAERAELHVYADDRIVNNFDLDVIEIGTTKILTVENLKISRSADEVRFVVDEGNYIDEIIEDNNDKILVLAE